MRYPEHLDRWIVLFLQGRLDEKDKIKLETWRKASFENEMLFRRLCSEAHWRQGVREIASYDEEEGWKAVMTKIQRHRASIGQWRKWCGVAAAVLIVMGMSIMAWLKMPEAPERTVMTQLENVIRLDVASGQSFCLDSAKRIETGKAVMKNNGKRLVVETTKTTEKVIEWHTITVPRGADYSLVLSDGTEIFLNAETVLRFPDRFETGGKREVWVKGEAYFKVQRDSLHPFIVHSRGTSVRVLGTVFNVMAYANQPEIQVTLVSGKVKVKADANDQEVILDPGEQAIYHQRQKILTERAVDVSYYTAWQEGIFAFRECPLVQVMETLARWYDFEVFFQNTQARNFIYTGKIKRHATLKEVLESFRQTKEFDFSIHGKTIIIK